MKNTKMMGVMGFKKISITTSDMNSFTRQVFSHLVSG